MAITDVIIHHRRHLKRRNYSPQTIKSYMNKLMQFVRWVDVPIEQVAPHNISAYIDFLLYRRLRPKTINCHLDTIRCFYHYLIEEEQLVIDHPVKRGYALRLSQPLPRYLKDEEVNSLLKVIQSKRDRAMFMLMLRCGLRVDEVANLTMAALDLPRSQIFVYNGKGGKDRVVYVSDDTYDALKAYIKIRRSNRPKKVFLVERGVYKGRPISVRGIQKRVEYYARKSGVKASCHKLRHTMATQLLNADADLVTIQDLLGHSRIRTTQRYARVSNIKVQRDYYKAMTTVMERTL